MGAATMACVLNWMRAVLWVVIATAINLADVFVMVCAMKGIGFAWRVRTKTACRLGLAARMGVALRQTAFALLRRRMIAMDRVIVRVTGCVTWIPMVCDAIGALRVLIRVVGSRGYAKKRGCAGRLAGLV